MKWEGYIRKHEDLINYFQMLADAGDNTAMENLGHIYSLNYGITKDKSKAIKWYEKAAENGSARAMFTLGLINEYGYAPGMSVDKLKALMWY